MLRMIIKGMLLPAFVALAILEWILSLISSLSGMVFRLIAGIFILAGLLSFGFGLELWNEAVRMIWGGAVFFILPLAAEVFMAGITLLKAMIRIF